MNCPVRTPVLFLFVLHLHPLASEAHARTQLPELQLADCLPLSPWRRLHRLSSFAPAWLVAFPAMAVLQTRAQQQQQQHLPEQVLQGP